MDNKAKNKKTLIVIARALGELKDDVVFVGGTVVDFYANDPAAEEIRETKDIDFVMVIVTFSKLEELRQKLIEKGFTQSHEDDVTCRFRYQEILVDVMSIKQVGWAPSSPWFESGLSNTCNIKIDGTNIRILSLPFYLATKFSAFQDRGSEDPFISHDLEDIVYIINNRTDFVDVLRSGPPDVLSYLKNQFKNLLESATLREAIEGNLEYTHREERFQTIVQKLKQIINY